MELPKITRPEGGFGGGMLDNIKSRLGFSNGEDNRGYDDYEYDEYDDDFEDDFDFGDEGFDEDEYGDGYEPYAPVTTRSTGRTYSSTPRLVTIGDVKSNTADRLSRGSYSDAPTTGTRDRVVIDTTNPAPSSPAYSRPEGSAPRYTASSRNLTVVRPMAYNDVERVARIVRTGDVAVLSLKNTPENLFNRVLDFAFGVASALDAQVDCIGTKVFAISTGAGLSESEKNTLRGQGVI